MRTYALAIAIPLAACVAAAWAQVPAPVQATGQAVAKHRQGGATVAAFGGPSTELSAQSRTRPNIRVYRYSQPPFWDHPRPGTYSWPGPDAKRDCRAWYVLEHRQSGTVMTPRTRCEWVPG